MLRSARNFFSKHRKIIPILATALLALVAYGIGAYLFVGMRNPQVFFNLFRNNAHILISAIGMTLVIVTGGIDLSVSGVVALTTVSTAVLLREGWNPWVVILLMLAMGMGLGGIMGSFIVKLKVQPFIATLAGMWFARGMCFFISDDAVQIDNRLFHILGKTKILIPGLTELAESRGTPPPYVTIAVVVAFILLIVAMYIAQYSRFGRTVYAIGGNEGRNEQSARLMGLAVDRTKLLVYTFNGFCSAVAGLAYALFVESGHGLYASGFELEVIASVVMGGTMLTGGVGYVFGTLFGVLVYSVTQVLIQFIGSLSSWWTRIVIGVLTLMSPGLKPTIRDLATLMIILSDNQATDILLGKVGAENVTATMRKLGLSNIRVDRTTFELIRDYLALIDPAAGGKSKQQLMTARPQLNVATAERRLSGVYTPT